MSLDGWIVLDKPLGLTSAQAVARIKRLLRESGHGRVKIGHGGTLDPLATGVLPIGLGEATKLLGRMLNGNKAYRFTLRFGAETTTDDAEGAVARTSPVRPGLAAIRAVLPAFTGPISQIPPAFSALKVAGERAYARARAGETVTLQPRTVTIHDLDIVDFREPDEITISVSCSKGTYVRALGRDIARALGTAGHLGALRRTRSGPFCEADAISLEFLAKALYEPGPEQAIRPLMSGLDDIPVLPIDPDQAARLKHGQRLAGLPEPDGAYLATLGSVPVAWVDLHLGEARVVRGFNLQDPKGASDVDYS